CAVVGAGRVVVDVPVVVVPAVGIGDLEPVATGAARVAAHPGDYTVARGELVQEARADEVVAFVPARPPVAPARAGVGVGDGLLHGEDDAAVGRDAVDVAVGERRMRGEERARNERERGEAGRERGAAGGSANRSPPGRATPADRHAGAET